MLEGALSGLCISKYCLELEGATLAVSTFDVVNLYDTRKIEREGGEE